MQTAFTRTGREWGLTPVCSTAYGGNYSTWWGISCQLGRVWEVLLKLMFVVGPVSDVLGNLTQLRVLNLYGNQLTGSPSGHSLQIVAMSRPCRLSSTRSLFRMEGHGNACVLAAHEAPGPVPNIGCAQERCP